MSTDSDMLLVCIQYRVNIKHDKLLHCVPTRQRSFLRVTQNHQLGIQLQFNTTTINISAAKLKLNIRCSIKLFIIQ